MNEYEWKDDVDLRIQESLECLLLGIGRSLSCRLRKLTLCLLRDTRVSGRLDRLLLDLRLRDMRLRELWLGNTVAGGVLRESRLSLLRLDESSLGNLLRLRIGKESTHPQVSQSRARMAWASTRCKTHESIKSLTKILCLASSLRLSISLSRAISALSLATC